MAAHAPPRFSDFIQLSKDLDGLYHQMSLKAGLSDSMLALLYSLCERQSPPTAIELAQEWSLTKQTVHSALAAMERQGIITTGGSPADRRRKLIFLTPSGQALCRERILPILEAERRSFARLTPGERETLMALTAKANQYLKEETAALR